MVTVVTGASSGIGHSLAQRLAGPGEAIALIARSEAPLVALADRLQATGVRALAVVCDVTDRAATQRAFARIEAELGPVTRLVANAGGGVPTFVDAFDAGEIADVLQLNFMGVVHAIEAVLPGMLARGDGHLVVTGSLAAVRGLPTAAAYGAAKAGIAHFMESLRVDLRGRGIAVTVLLPGFVQTKVRNKAGKRKSRFKPFQMDLEQATARMAHAIERRRSTAAMPRRLAGVVRLLEFLPASVYDNLLSGRGRQRKY